MRLFAIFILMVFFLFGCGNNSTGPDSLETDRDILVAFYRATNGDGWRSKTNWMSDKDLSTWFGVTVSNGRVHALGA